ncbi:DNA polymerase alpha catalytic subunit [Kipferlia bialata]|uniref:DNA polymerase n=1 Tax=Kipferlia bialata TaxID=797122 RepID=A0A9K3GFA3_9EUKA|nr:DNA polymerase alpha catalytic subunit [Kipferlia bialata]|eukprot:g1467.t1
MGRGRNEDYDFSESEESDRPDAELHAQYEMDRAIERQEYDADMAAGGLDVDEDEAEKEAHVEPERAIATSFLRASSGGSAVHKRSGREVEVQKAVASSIMEQFSQKIASKPRRRKRAVLKVAPAPAPEVDTENPLLAYDNAMLSSLGGEAVAVSTYKPKAKPVARVAKAEVPSRPAAPVPAVETKPEPSRPDTVSSPVSSQSPPRAPMSPPKASMPSFPAPAGFTMSYDLVDAPVSQTERLARSPSPLGIKGSQTESHGLATGVMRADGGMNLYMTGCWAVRNDPSSAYVFGKAKGESGRYESVAMRVEGLQWQMHFLPTPEYRDCLFLEGGEAAQLEKMAQYEPTKLRSVDNPAIAMTKGGQDESVYERDFIVSSKLLDVQVLAKLADEASNIISRANRGERAALNVRVVWGQYVFHDPTLPRQWCPYIRVTYSARGRANQGGLTVSGSGMFSHVLGHTTAPVDNYLVRQGLRGPGWVSAGEVTKAGLSVKASHTFLLGDNSTLHPLRSDLPLPPPPLSALTIHFTSAFTPCVQRTKKGKAASPAFERSIVGITTVYSREYHTDASPAEPPSVKTRSDDVSVFLGGVLGTTTPDPDTAKGTRRGRAKCILSTPLPDIRREEGAQTEGLHDAEALGPPIKRSYHGVGYYLLDSEKNLLKSLTSYIDSLNPDVLIMHDAPKTILTFYKRVLATWGVRDSDKKGSKRTHLPSWGWMLGRLRGNIPSPDLFVENRAPLLASIGTFGRLLVSAAHATEEFRVQPQYTLPALTSALLKQRLLLTDDYQIQTLLVNSQSVQRLMAEAVSATYATLDIAHSLSVLPLTREIACLTGHHWQRVLTSGRAERLESMLLHTFTRRGYICPDKPVERKKGEKGADAKGPQYKGGLVLEPVPGLYTDGVVVLDFNSLYPSLIRERNLCFTSIPPASDECPVPSDEGAQDELTGILPQLLAGLVNRRGEVKKQLKQAIKSNDTAQAARRDIQQLALKICANAMYGSLGYTRARFYAPHLAALTTKAGREELEAVRRTAIEMGHTVVYGDTDSIMVNVGMPVTVANKAAIDKICHDVSASVKDTHNVLELGLDYIFARFLLLKKKKYAAVKVDYRLNAEGRQTLHKVVEMKGLDLVRRDWCKLSKSAGKMVLNIILQRSDAEGETSNVDIAMEVYRTLNTVSEKVRKQASGVIQPDPETQRLPSYLGIYGISKQLSRDPSGYADVKALPHVQVALTMRKEGRNVSTTAGSVVTYFMAKGDGPPGCKPEPVSIFGLVGRELDLEWYLSNQVLPPVSRLCAVIDTISPVDLARSLGLSREHQQNAGMGFSEPVYGDTSLSQDLQTRFARCVPLRIPCGNAQEECSGCIQWPPGVDRGLPSAPLTVSKDMLCCNVCNRAITPVEGATAAFKLVHRLQSLYHACVPSCNDASCSFYVEDYKRNSLITASHRQYQDLMRGLAQYRGSLVGGDLLENGKCPMPDCLGERSSIYSPEAMRDQLLYLRDTLTPSSALLDGKQRMTHDVKQVAQAILEPVLEAIEDNDFLYVDLSKVFEAYQFDAIDVKTEN